MSGTTQEAVTNKKPKRNNGKDYISSIPDDVMSVILCHITTKEAVRTSILSREWKYRWTCIESVKFDDQMIHDRDGFLRFLESSAPKLRKLVTFKLLCRGEYEWDRISACILEILKCEIKCLWLALVGSSTRAKLLPSSILMKTSLTELVLVFPCVYRVPTQNKFPNMRKLSLKGVRFRKVYNTGTLFFTFPVLEECRFSECDWLNVDIIEICAPKLRTFCSETKPDYDDPEAERRTIKIIGANLKEFNLAGGHLENIIFTRSTVEIVRVVNIHPNLGNDIIEEEEKLVALGLRARKLLREFPGVKELKLSGLLAVAIGSAKEGLPLPVYDMLVKLELTDAFEDSGLRALLHASPCLKYLDLYENIYWDDWRGGFPDEEVNLPQCMLSHLEIVKFHEFECTDNRIYLSTLFIKYGAALKKFIVCACISDEDDIKENLSLIPRASNSLEIIIGGTVLV